MGSILGIRSSCALIFGILRYQRRIQDYSIGGSELQMRVRFDQMIVLILCIRIDWPEQCSNRLVHF